MSEYVIAKYIRLSQDDAVSESLSIPNQRLLLNSYIEELEIPNASVLEFVDNGHTGTNLERPAVQDMIELVRCGRINCIVVKDFSRFSRNAMESGYYIEQVFPLYRVRFIAIGENFDSNDYKDSTGGIDVAFRFLMHEHYSKDLSKKIRSAKRVLMQSGKYIVADAIYGYRKNDKGKWESDPEPAKVVRLIFQMALDGLSTSQIRDKMFEARYVTPREYADIKRGKEIMPARMWTTRMILRTLTNEQYTGCYISGKHELKRIACGARTVNDKSDWIIIPDSHPALIGKEDFDTVQKMLKFPKESAPCKPQPSRHSQTLNPRISKGERVSSAVPYGYVKADGGKWKIDNAAAEIVRKIYDWVLQGLTVKEICGRLYESGCPTPAEYFKLARGKEVQPTNHWPQLRISEILKDEQYTGAYIAGKSFQDLNVKKYRPPKSEWVIIPDKHPPVISKELFKQVQEIRAKSRKNMRQREYLLHGKVSCGCCGYALVYGDSTVPMTYRCMHTHADPRAECYKMKVNAGELEETVMTVIKKQADAVLQSGGLSGIRKVSDFERMTIECENEIKQWIEQRQRCYEQLVEAEIDREAYNTLKGECSSQLEKLNNRLAILKQGERDKQAYDKTAILAKEALADNAVPKDVVNALVDKILVFPNDKIEIQWKFVNFAVNI